MFNKKEELKFIKEVAKKRDRKLLEDAIVMVVMFGMFVTQANKGKTLEG